MASPKKPGAHLSHCLPEVLKRQRRQEPVMGSQGVGSDGSTFPLQSHRMQGRGEPEGGQRRGEERRGRTRTNNCIKDSRILSKSLLHLTSDVPQRVATVPLGTPLTSVTLVPLPTVQAYNHTATPLLTAGSKLALRRHPRAWTRLTTST